MCPTGALQQDDGIVTMNAQICSAAALYHGLPLRRDLAGIHRPALRHVGNDGPKEYALRGRALRPVQGLDEARGQIRARLRRSLPRPRPKRGADRLIPAQSLMV
ncbi:MAG: hypothetical protein ACLSTO_00430 [Bilophila wadsworthia]